MYIIKKENNQYILYKPNFTRSWTGQDKIKILTLEEAAGLVNTHKAIDETGDFPIKSVRSNA